MSIQRRVFLRGGSAFGLLALPGLLVSGMSLSACMKKPAAVLQISAQGTANMNLGPDGTDRPVTLSILQMSGASNFDNADIMALQSPQDAIGSELIKVDTIVLAPGAVVPKSVMVQDGATVIGVTAGFISPAGKTVRQKIAAPARGQGLIIKVDRSGIVLSTA